MPIFGDYFVKCIDFQCWFSEDLILSIFQNNSGFFFSSLFFSFTLSLSLFLRHFFLLRSSDFQGCFFSINLINDTSNSVGVRSKRCCQ